MAMRGVMVSASLALGLWLNASVALAACAPLLDVSFRPLAGKDREPVHLCEAYEGKVLLVVNTASYCGYTPQYQGLEALHAKYAARGLVVMGFPSNDFNQEDADAGKIAELCFNTYGVKFPMFAKTAVKGAQAHALYQSLTQATGKAPPTAAGRSAGGVAQAASRLAAPKLAHACNNFIEFFAPWSIWR